MNYLEKVSKVGWSLSLVPHEFRTPELCLAAVKKDSYNLLHVPEKHITSELYLAVFKKRGYPLALVPHKYRTPEMCLMAVKKYVMDIRYVPKVDPATYSFVRPYEIAKDGKYILLGCERRTKAGWLATTAKEMFEKHGGVAGTYLPVLKYQIKKGLLY